MFLCTDVVGYSRLLTNEQKGLIERLNEIVRTSGTFRSAEAAGRLMRIATGDGMVLVFYKTPAQPVECALEIATALKEHPELPVRMASIAAR